MIAGHIVFIGSPPRLPKMWSVSAGFPSRRGRETSRALASDQSPLIGRLSLAPWKPLTCSVTADPNEANGSWSPTRTYAVVPITPMVPVPSVPMIVIVITDMVMTVMVVIAPMILVMIVAFRVALILIVLVMVIVAFSGEGRYGK